MRNVLDKILEKVETQKVVQHDVVEQLFSENRAVYEIMSKNMLEPEGPQMTTQHGAYELHAG
jgi:hypothetical protein